MCRASLDELISPLAPKYTTFWYLRDSSRLKNVSRVGSENSYFTRRNLYFPSPSLTSYVSSSISQSFRIYWTTYSVYSIIRGRKLASGYTLDLGQLEIHSNDIFENWTYPESNPAFVPSVNFQLADPPVENTEFSIKVISKVFTGKAIYMIRMMTEDEDLE